MPQDNPAALSDPDAKRTLSEQSAGKPDYDDYTRAKTAFFDEVHPLFSTWAENQRRAIWASGNALNRHVR